MFEQSCSNIFSCRFIVIYLYYQIKYNTMTTLPITIKIEKTVLEFELSFDNNMYSVKDVETKGIVLDGFFISNSAKIHSSHHTIKYFATEIKTKADKIFKKHKLIK